ncbi:MAG: glycosyltransferase family 9 protein [Bacteroidia bacterium]|nr:glycosyltransferase family 9 protein [Bacteroidia bacterium]MDW8089224.1 glycosyltransferase family 9 protein [Bacteroidia bacterium]
MDRYLVIQPAFLGDALLTLPLLGKLRAAFPLAEIHWLVRKGIGELVLGHPWEIIPHEWDKSWRGWWDLWRRLAQRPWRTIIVVQRFFRMGLLGRLLPAEKYITYTKNPLSFLYTHALPHRFGDGTHEIERVLALGEPLGLSVELTPRPWLFPPESARQTTEAWRRRKPYLILAPTSRWATKEAPWTFWRTFLQRIGREFRIYVTGTAAERKRLIGFEAFHPQVEVLAGRLSLLELAALVAEAEAVYTVDSAVMHLATALNRPTAAVFCSTTPAFGFGPRAERYFILEPSVPLACRPCGRHGKSRCPQKHFLCGTSLNAALLPVPHTLAALSLPTHTASYPLEK